jgi:transcription elongation factor Elf1
MGYPLCDESKVVVALVGEQATGEPGVVNCKACKEHVDFPKDWVEMDASRVPDINLARMGKPTSG